MNPEETMDIMKRLATVFWQIRFLIRDRHLRFGTVQLRLHNGEPVRVEGVIESMPCANWHEAQALALHKIGNGKIILEIKDGQPFRIEGAWSQPL